MREVQTVYGKLSILDHNHIFLRIAQAIKEVCMKKVKYATVGLTGGSTPKEFYKWATAQNVFYKQLLDQVIWMTSDERYVPLKSEESNFGNADRLMLDPYSVSKDSKFPWRITLSPEKAAADYDDFFLKHNKEKCFDLCLLGMGDDCHIASIFPGSPLIDENPSANFAAIEVPGKGIRLTITPNGLKKSGQIIMIVTGKAKSAALKKVLEGKYNPKEYPAQLHKEWSQKVTWLVDEDAASELILPPIGYKAI